MIAGSPGSNQVCGVATPVSPPTPCYGLGGVDGLGNPAAPNGADGAGAGPGVAQDPNVFNLY
ncbi:MAG TPA: hypothetical protein VKV27_06320 [Solirubrobacteraceae bacterium]|nr:hypothetical protein [Solirubrobacteraceae bacterium]